jgi:hypothetical protein
LKSRKTSKEFAMFDLTRLLKALSARAGALAEFQRMLEWKLLRGSHDFPGPDGGTCINEAAIVAAGYPYRAVYCVKDLPLSFSRPIALLALCLNDTLDDELRQELLGPFVTRLAGSVDAPAIEMARAELMLARSVTEILAPALARAGLIELASRCRSIMAAGELLEIAQALGTSERCKLPQPLLSAVEHAADGVAHLRGGLPTDVVFCTFSLIREISLLDGNRGVEEIYRSAAAILGAALDIGNQADDSGLDLAAKRLDDARRMAASSERREALAQSR